MVQLGVSLLVGSEFRVREASFEFKKWVSSKKSEFRVKTKVSFEYEKCLE